VSCVYLVRHGQAGTRHDYDALSHKGCTQARLLGAHFNDQRIHFDQAFSGSLKRQQETAAEVATVHGTLPRIKVDAGWDEFDLDHVYKILAPILCEEDADFRREYESMRAELEAAADHEAAVHRRWTPADLKIVQAWIHGHTKYTGESWLDFHARISRCRATLAAAAHDSDDHNIVVFTSATPIGIWAALSLDVDDHRAMRLAGVLHNASYTVMRLRPDQLRLHAFNAIPHLPDREFHTYR
jgi:broad specificity phosphatase PhoE